MNGVFEYLEYLGDPPAILDDTELYKETRKTILVVLLTRLGVVPGQLLKLQAQQHHLERAVPSGLPLPEVTYPELAIRYRLRG